ncbi:MAG: hypothetical protein P4L20_09075, partial [Acidimicrobiales bacterium]|nr:hypothetical protein [Acidimicrobiales bacterium]
MHTRLFVVVGGLIALIGLGFGTVAYATSHADTTISPTAVPLGDGHVASTPKKGWVDSCSTTFPPAPPGTTPPWINAGNHTWDSEAKVAVQGSVSWPSASYSVTVTGTTRKITTTDLPVDHTTGVFPIAASDPAHAYDANPNHI